MPRSERVAWSLCALVVVSMVGLLLNVAFANRGGVRSPTHIRDQARLILASGVFAIAAPLAVMALSRVRRRDPGPKRKPNPLDDFA